MCTHIFCFVLLGWRSVCVLFVTGNAHSTPPPMTSWLDLRSPPDYAHFVIETIICILTPQAERCGSRSACAGQQRGAYGPAAARSRPAAFLQQRAWLACLWKHPPPMETWAGLEVRAVGDFWILVWVCSMTLQGLRFGLQSRASRPNRSRTRSIAIMGLL
jgi:hypothetical protein